MEAAEVLAVAVGEGQVLLAIAGCGYCRCRENKRRPGELQLAPVVVPFGLLCVMIQKKESLSSHNMEFECACVHQSLGLLTVANPDITSVNVLLNGVKYTLRP
jgi:hypothetical protein